MKSVNGNTVVHKLGIKLQARRRLTSALILVIALLVPLTAGSAKKSFKPAFLLDGPVKAKDSSLGEGNSQVKTKNWIFVVRVGDYRYVGDVGRTGGLFNLKGKPSTDDWPSNPDKPTIEVYFHRRMGSLYMDLKGPTGKEETAWVISKVGPDGKELCGKISCKKTAEDDED